MEQLQCLVHIPTVDVQNTIDGQLDHITNPVEPEIALSGAHINEAHIIVAVRRSKAPSTATGLHGQKDAAVLPLLNFMKLFFDQCFHGQHRLSSLYFSLLP